MKWKVKQSKIHGNGVFAAKNLDKDEDIGVSIPLVFENKNVKIFERNTFGLLINDSKTPNTKIIKIINDWHFVSLKKIKLDEELLVDYSDYEAKINREALTSKKGISVI